MKRMCPVVHFELPAKDKKRMMEFYGKAFGWEMNMLGEDMGNYVVAMTAESNRNGPIKPGVINGGFYDRSNDDVSKQHPSFVISVDDIIEYIKIVEAAGGKIIGKPTDIPGVGMYVGFIDTEGNILSMLQAQMPKDEED